MIEIAIIIFLGIALVGLGVIIDRLLYGNKIVSEPDKTKTFAESVTEIVRDHYPSQEMPGIPVNKEDVINHEGVGIVHRPTNEEIEKMHEPQNIKDAKAAIEETIRNTPEPQI